MCDYKKEFLCKIENYNKFPFYISDHARKRAKEREIEINLVMEQIIENKTLINAEKQGNHKYKVTYQIKGFQKFSYIIEFKKTHIELVTLWKINNKLQKRINKKWKNN